MKDQSGFTIVELLATIVVFGIASLGIANLFYSMQYVQQQASHLDIATRAAQREVEVLRNNTYNALVVGQTIDFSSSLPDALPQNKSGTVTVTEPSPGLKRVDVSVTYMDGSKQQQVQLSSIIGVLGLSK